MPGGLVGAFRATLEELDDADLLLHVADLADPSCEEQIRAVEKLLGELGLAEKPVLRVLNKVDLLASDEREARVAGLGGIGISARDPSTFGPLLDALERRFWAD